MGRAINDLKGKRFGMLLVLEKDEEKLKNMVGLTGFANVIAEL